MDVLGLIIQQEAKKREWTDFDIQDVEVGISQKDPSLEIVPGKDAFAVIYGVYAYGTANANIITVDGYAYQSSNMRYIFDVSHFYSDVCKLLRQDARIELNGSDFRKCTIKYVIITKR